MAEMADSNANVYVYLPPVEFQLKWRAREGGGGGGGGEGAPKSDSKHGSLLFGSVVKLQVYDAAGND